jgi:hypothetical protein
VDYGLPFTWASDAANATNIVERLFHRIATKRDGTMGRPCGWAGIMAFKSKKSPYRAKSPPFETELRNNPPGSMLQGNK